MKINLASQLHIPSPDRTLPDYIVARFGPRNDDTLIYRRKLTIAEHLDFEDWGVREYYGNKGWRVPVFSFTGN
jgi:hypothetical protein